MRVSHYNTFLDGGAATASRRLHSELVRMDVDSQYFYSANQGEPLDLDGTYHAATWNQGNVANRLIKGVKFRQHRQSFKRALRGRSSGHEIFTSPKGAAYTPWPPMSHGDDDQIIHLHWIDKFIDQTSFFGSLEPQQPVVWTLHDMNAFTGGCHFSEGCDRYLSGCGNCPQLPSPAEKDFSHQSFQAKSKAIQDINLHIAAPSRWLIETAKSSTLLQSAKSFSHIPYGINTETYYPMDRQEARGRLGIDPDATVVCFGAMDVKNIRKGGKQMAEAFAAIADLPEVLGLVFGGGELPKSSNPMPPIHSVGPIAGTLQQRTVFSAADVFVLPSLEDNLPLTGLEAMACGTPIVAFNAGGIPDYVRPGISGSLAKTGCSEDLAQKLVQLLTDRPTLSNLGQSARVMIENEYASTREANRYQQLYRDLVTTKSRFLAA
ncbi:Capsular glucan synthase [Rubripirellula obstinata]|uniref:Capsular glucan synthase n=1 Tax=Rubripirellula obstinata TaxID=406547 RepID=A0A5B1CL01_9BACT|nr:glycosyltransferase [Rubripirellula obstinata]KAA1260991.1 Capsular glucan synthase [Rubripirellula obstinata]